MRVSTAVTRLAFLSTLIASGAWAQGTAVLTGTVTDAASGKPVADVVVTATSPSLQGEEIVVTDATGLYRIPQLPAGSYTLRLEKESFKPYSRGDINLRVDRTIRLNVQLQPESVTAEEVVVVGKAPTVDIGSTSTGLSVGKEFINNIPFIQPNAAGTRSFEALAAAAPQVNADTYGFSMNGTTSPENGILVDGISVTDPGYGGLQSTTGSPYASDTLASSSIPVEFIEEVNVVTGGYMPEFGRSTGGILNAVTKSGSNEFHGSVFGSWTPGALQGSRPKILTAASSIETQRLNWNTGDFGVELGGPIVKDRLWFYAGFSPSISRDRTRRTLYRLEYDTAGDPVLDDNGEQKVTELPGTTEYRFHDSRAYNYLAKLTLGITANQNLALSISGAPKVLLTPTFTPRRIAGARDTNDNLDISLKYTAGFFNKTLLIDGMVGWHHQDTSTGPDDGTGIGSTGGAGGTPAVIFRARRSLLAYENLNPEAAAMCADVAGGPIHCQASGDGSTYTIGGAGYMERSKLDRLQAKLVGTYLLNALGHHVIKAGIDYARSSYEANKDYGGGVLVRENLGGTAYRDFRQYGYFTAPDEFVNLGGRGKSGTRQTSITSEFGAFAQDSWNVMDVVTLNAGLRYDTQQLFAGDGTLGMNLTNMFSPRFGLIYDFTQKGQSKIYASYARFYESVPLSIADRALSGEYQGGFNRARTKTASRQGCQPLVDINQTLNECQDPHNYTSFATPTELSATGLVTGAGKSPVDPNLQAQSSDEFLAGAEYEIIQDGRLGVSYTRRWMNSVIEDMSRDEATTYFIGNPGSGIATDFPKAKRDYDAVTVFFSKSFADLWQAQVSYTWSYLRGNYAGLFKPETDQLNPNINSDFDLQSLLANRDGPLPADRTHVIKAFGAKEFVLNGTFSVTLGLAYRGRSGTPISYLASHPIYGADESFVLPRGSAGRLPWVHNIDGKLVAQAKITKDNAVQLSVDIFNMFNFAGVTRVDESLSSGDILPYSSNDPNVDPYKATCVSGNTAGCVPQLKQYEFNPLTGNVTGTGPVSTGDFSPNFKRITQYQAPLTVRFGLKVTF